MDFEKIKQNNKNYIRIGKKLLKNGISGKNVYQTCNDYTKIIYE